MHTIVTLRMRVIKAFWLDWKGTGKCCFSHNKSCWDKRVFGIRIDAVVHLLCHTYIMLALYAIQFQCQLVINHCIDFFCWFVLLKYEIFTSSTKATKYG